MRLARSDAFRLAAAAAAAREARHAAGVFIGGHGGWNRAGLAGHKVVTGLLNGEGQVRGRPAGALLIVGDVGGTVAKTR